MSNIMEDPMDEVFKALLNNVANKEWQSSMTATNTTTTKVTPNDTKNNVLNYKNALTKVDDNKNTKTESLVLRWFLRSIKPPEEKEMKTTHKSPEVIVEIPTRNADKSAAQITRIAWQWKYGLHHPKWIH